MKGLLLKICIILPAAFLCCRGEPSTENGRQVEAYFPGSTFVCFVYHRFDDPKYPSTNISASDFEAHLRYLRERGFMVLTFSDAMEYVNSGEDTTRVAVITVDDGYLSFFVNGVPILRKYGMPATLFINTETVAAPGYMDWEQLKAAMASGIEIGNHTHSHAYFMNIEASVRHEAFREDVRKSQEIILEKLAVAPRIFAYPYGEFDGGMKRAVREAGFRYAAAQHSGVVHAGTDPYQIPRFPMAGPYAGLEGFTEKAAMRPLKIIRQVPDDVVMPPNDPRPLLQLTLQNDGLETSRMQCFVQGGGCALTIEGEDSDSIAITMRATGDLSGRRRTLYTVTVPDSAGQWHWYSHLWINPEAADH